MRLPLVLVLGGGELGSAVAHRLVRSGIQVAIADLEAPACIRRGVSFAVALTEGAKQVEGVTAVAVRSAAGARETASAGKIPVVTVGTDPGDIPRLVGEIGADVVVDARMLKRNQGVLRGLAPLVVGLGPGFEAPRQVHAVVETNRGHDLGRVLYEGQAQPDTGVPGDIGGYTDQRLLRAPASGVFLARAALGQSVAAGETVGSVEGSPVAVQIAGLLRGLVADGARVRAGQKIGDVDPRGEAIDFETISDKGRAVAGSVLEVIIRWWSGAAG
jgi:xanthine dehydrogenase accessory factor